QRLALKPVQGKIHPFDQRIETRRDMATEEDSRARTQDVKNEQGREEREPLEAAIAHSRERRHRITRQHCNRCSFMTKLSTKAAASPARTADDHSNRSNSSPPGHPKTHLHFCAANVRSRLPPPLILRRKIAYLASSESR